MRITPRPWIAVATVVGFAALFLGLELFSRVDYTGVVDSTGNARRAIVIPEAIGAVLLIAVTTGLGWWRPVYRDDQRAPRWLWAVPILVVAGVLAALATADWRAVSPSLLVTLAIGTALVGFNEELLFRGLAVVGLRGGASEWVVCIGSAAMFGLFHGVNVFLGQDIGATVGQVGQAFLLGVLFYVMRRVSGTILLPMVVHFLWDFGAFLNSAAVQASGTKSVGPAIEFLLYLAATLVVIFGVRSLFHPSGGPASRRRPVQA